MSETSPNLIWIFGDQHRAQALGCAGDVNVHTPNIDRMASEGVFFKRALIGSPLCCPARGSILSGRYPHHCVPGHEDPLPAGQKTLAHAFRGAGYHTAYFGKWHLGGFKERNGRGAFHIVPPESRGGFDSWIGYENNNSPWDSWIHGGEGKSAFHERLPDYETDSLTDLFIKHLKERSLEKAKPFFAALSVQPPHNPYIAPEPWMAKHTPGEIKLRLNVPPIARLEEAARRDLAGYYAMIENLDHNIGRIRETLRETGLWENTYLVFFSDHGDLHGSHGQFKKTSPFEESIRVPLIVAGGIPFYGLKNGESMAPVNHVDIAPTTLGMCGIPKPEWMEGFDYSGAIIKGKESASEPDSAFLQMVNATGHYDSVDRPWRGIVTRDGWKYAALEGQPWMLFNLNEDPYELANHAHNPKYQFERKKLQQRLSQWIGETGDTFADLNF